MLCLSQMALGDVTKVIDVTYLWGCSPLFWPIQRYFIFKIVFSYITHSRRRQWHPTPVLLPGKSHGWRSLEGCSPWGRWGSDTTEPLDFHLSLSCVGEGNGNPLQCSCLENPRDGGAWWAPVYGVAQSRTRLKRLRSSSSRELVMDREAWRATIHGVAKGRTWLSDWRFSALHSLTYNNYLYLCPF